MSKFYKSNSTFWENLDQIVQSHHIVVDRPAGSRHPRYPEYIYPLDYGYLQNTKSTDGMELDIWVGTLTQNTVTGVMIIADMDKSDTEMKILYACSKEELELIYKINNEYNMSAVLLIRED